MRDLGRIILASSILLAAVTVSDAGAGVGSGGQRAGRFRPARGKAFSPAGRGPGLQHSRPRSRPNGPRFGGGRPHFDQAVKEARAEGAFRARVHHSDVGAFDITGTEPFLEDGRARGVDGDHEAVVIKRVNHIPASWLIRRARVVELMTRTTGDKRSFVPQIGPVARIARRQGGMRLVEEVDQIVMPFYQGDTVQAADDIDNEEITRAAVVSFVLGLDTVTREDVIVDRAAFKIVGWDRSSLGVFRERPWRRKTSPFRERVVLGLEPRERWRTRRVPGAIRDGLASLRQLSDEVLKEEFNMNPGEATDFRERISLVLEHGIDQAMEMKDIAAD